MKNNRKRNVYIACACGAAVLAAVVVLLLVFSGGRQYAKYYAEAQTAYADKDYDTALEKLAKAIDKKPTEDAYLLMAQIYVDEGKPDMAVQTLTLGAAKIGGDRIAQKLAELKAGSDTSSDAIEIAGHAASLDARSLVLSDLGLTDSDIPELAKLTALEELSLSDNRLTDVSVLSGLSNLSFLQLSGNKISDLSPLSGLKRLKTLYIDNNPVTDLTPLYNLTSLRTLSMKGVDITGEQLAQLQAALPECSIYSDETPEEVVDVTICGKTFKSDVTELDLSGLGATDLSALAPCSKLQKLDLSENEVTDLSPLVDLQALEWLDVSKNQISDLRPLMTLTKLTYLAAADDKVSDLTVLEYLTGLQTLVLDGSTLSGVASLPSLTALETLSLKNCGVKDAWLDTLAKLTSLKSLALDDNAGLSSAKVANLEKALPGCKISSAGLTSSVTLGGQTFSSDADSITAVAAKVTSLAGLEEFKALKTLVLTNNSVSDLAPLKDLSALEALDLYGNQVSDLSPLAGHTKLRTADLMRNRISDISALGSCTGLRELHLSFNSVSDVSALAACVQLTTLDLDGNKISDVSALAGLKNLTELSLDDNSIGDLSPLYSLKNLQTLYIRGNNLGYDAVAALRAALPNCTVVAES